MADTDAYIVKIAKAGWIAGQYREKLREKGENFNIFSILKYERKEVKTHSAFLYELLNINGSHNRGNLFLKLFLESIGFRGETAKFNCKREVVIPNKKRIDFVIEDTKNIIIIEMKVDADDSEDQLKDYYEYGEKYAKEKDKTPHYYFLTPDGREPAKSEKVKDKFKRISFAEHIRAFIQKAIRECDSENIRLSLQHYLKVVNNITGQISKGEIMEIEGLINGTEAAMGALEIYRALPDILAKKELEFWDSVAKEIDRDIIEKYPRYVHDTSFEEVKSGSYTNPIREAMSEAIKSAQVLSGGYYGLFFAAHLVKTNRYINLSFFVSLNRINKKLTINFGAECSVYDVKSDKNVPIDFPKPLQLTGKNGNTRYRYFDKELYLPRNMKTNNDPKWGWLFDKAEMQEKIKSTAEEINKFLALYKECEAEVIEKANRAK